MNLDAQNGCAIRSVAEICESIDYGHTAAATVYRGGPRFLRITDVQDGKVDWSRVPGCTIDSAEESASSLRDGDIVFARTGATTGKSYLIKDPPRAIFASYLIRLRLNRTILSPEYVYLFFQSDAYWQQLRAFARGAAQPNVNATLLGKLEVPVRPLAEQERLAARLSEQMSAVERARAAATERLAAAEALPAANLREVFENWAGPTALMRDGLARIEAGTSVQSLERPARDGEWGVLKVSAVSWRRFKGEENKAVPSTYVQKPHEVVKRGDLLISRANTAELAGAIVLVHETPTRLMLSDKTLRLVLRPNVLDAQYLEFAMRTLPVRRFIERHATGTSYSMRNISQETIRDIRLPAPPLTDQRHIAGELSRRLAEAERLAGRIREELAAIEALPAALLREAFGDSALSDAGGADE